MSVDSLRRDLAFGVRGHRRTPIVTAIVVATLALGIAASSVAFSLVNGVFLRPPPFQDPERFVRVYHHTGTSAQYLPISYPEFDEIRKLDEVFDGALVEEPVEVMVRVPLVSRARAVLRGRRGPSGPRPAGSGTSASHTACERACLRYATGRPRRQARTVT